MARMSEEQKATNKAASKERSQAFSARRKVYERELAAAEAASEQLPEHAAKVEAQQAFELALAQRKEAVDEIDREIARLQAKREEVHKQHTVVVGETKAQRDLAFDACADAQGRLTDVVKASFPDMVGVYLVSHWQRPEGV